jgi:hemolysin III
VPILLLRRPDPWPAVFGYHEVWHGCTVLAAALHFGAVALVVAAN